MQQIKKQAFTLVELIVVITILAILGTIAFISLQGYSSQARDSKRLSDIQNIKKSLELFSLDTSKYPLPDGGEEVLYEGDTVWTQGIIGDQVTTNLSRNLTKKPIDPLTDLEYTYSVVNGGIKYELLSLYESDLVGQNNLFNRVKAEEQDYPKVDGNYNGLFVKTSNYYVASPSIITSELLPEGGLTLDDTTIDSQIITGGSISTGGLDINLAAYTGSISEKEVEAKGTEFVETIKLAYEGTDLANKDIYQELLTLDTSNIEIVKSYVESIIFNKNTYISIKQVTNGECGTANKIYSYSETSYGEDNFCSSGISNPAIPDFPTEGEIIEWSCEGIDGGISVDCSSSRTITPINGECGSSDTVATLIAPSINLCNSGNATLVTTNTADFTWSCEGINEGETFDCSAPRQYTVNFEETGGSAVTNKTVTYNTSVGTLPTTTMEGSTFNGWYTASSGGTQITTSTIITGDITYYAQWTINSYTVNFEETGGSAVTNKTVTYNTSVGTLPTTTMEGSTFNGWYTASSGGTQITTSTIITGDVTYYAQWTDSCGQSNHGNTSSIIFAAPAGTWICFVGSDNNYMVKMKRTTDTTDYSGAGANRYVESDYYYSTDGGSTRISKTADYDYEFTYSSTATNYRIKTDGNANSGSVTVIYQGKLTCQGGCPEVQVTEIRY